MARVVLAVNDAVLRTTRVPRLLICGNPPRWCFPEYTSKISHLKVVAGACSRLDLQLEGLLAAVFGLHGTEENSTAAMVDSRTPALLVADRPM